MTLFEVKMNLFDSKPSVYLAHCISADFAMGAGIAKQFTERGVKDYLQLNYMKDVWNNKGYALYASIEGYKGVYNLVTKEKYWMKPTYKTLRQSLEHLKNQIPDGAMLNMPCIGTGLDKLDWEIVRGIIANTFADKDIKITICKL